MEIMNQMLQESKTLPSGLQHRALGQMNSSYAELHDNVMESMYSSIITNIARWNLGDTEPEFPPLSNAVNYFTEANPLDEPTENVQMLIRNYEHIHKQAPAFAELMQRTHPAAVTFKPMKLLPGSYDSPLLAMKHVVQSHQLPRFVPYMSSWPFIKPVAKLQIQPEQEGKVEQLPLVEEQFGNPYHDFIGEMDFKQAYTDAQESPSPDVCFKEVLQFLNTYQYQLEENQQTEELRQLLAEFTDSQVMKLFDTLQNSSQKNIIFQQIIQQRNQFYVVLPEDLQKLAAKIISQRKVFITARYLSKSYFNVTSILAFSFGDKTDYIVDCLDLIDHMYLLREALIHPSVLKIASSAELLLCLQRDFRLFVAPSFVWDVFSVHADKSEKLAFLADKISKKNEMDYSLRPLTTAQEKEIAIELTALRHLFLRSSSAYIEEQQQVCQVFFGEMWDNECATLFQPMDVGRNPQETLMGCVQIFSDVVSRIENRRNQSTAGTRAGFLAGAACGQLEKYLPLAGQITDIAGSIHRQKANLGLLNQVVFGVKPSAKTSFSPPETPVNLAGALLFMGVQNAAYTSFASAGNETSSVTSRVENIVTEPHGMPKSQTVPESLFSALSKFVKQ